MLKQNHWEPAPSCLTNNKIHRTERIITLQQSRGLQMVKCYIDLGAVRGGGGGGRGGSTTNSKNTEKKLYRLL